MLAHACVFRLDYASRFVRNSYFLCEVSSQSVPIYMCRRTYHSCQLPNACSRAYRMERWIRGARWLFLHAGRARKKQCPSRYTYIGAAVRASQCFKKKSSRILSFLTAAFAATHGAQQRDLGPSLAEGKV